jgi:hypothetical protein
LPPLQLPAKTVYAALRSFSFGLLTFDCTTYNQGYHSAECMSLAGCMLQAPVRTAPSFTRAFLAC